MATATNIDVKQKLQSFSSTTKSNVTPNHPNFGEKIYISANDTPIKTFTNRPYSFIDPIIFPEAKLQFNVSTVQVNYLTSFKPKVSHNISSYKAGSNIPVENLESNFFTTSPLFTSLTDLLPSSLEEIKKNKDKCFKDGRNFIHSLIALTTFSQIKNKAIASITTKAFPNFSNLTHFTAN
jgi:hypothetical protein